MKARHIIFAGATALLLCAGMASCNGGKTKQMQAEIDSLHLSDSLHQEDVKQMADFVNVMSAGLDSISAQEGLIKQMGGREGRLDKAQMRTQLQGLAELLRNQRARITALETEMAGNNSAYGQRIKKLIAYYKTQLDEKDKQIAELQTQLNDKNANIAKLTESVNSLTSTNTQLQNTVENQSQTMESQRSTIAEQDETIHTGFVAIGTSKELKATGVIKGGFLAKKKVDSNNLNAENFSKVDIRNYNDVRLNSNNPTIMTQMPASSYEIVKNGNGTSTLHIKDPNLFWSVSKFLVVKL